MNNFCVYMRPLWRALFFIQLIFVASCSQISLFKPKVIISSENIPSFKNSDYSLHLENLKKSISNNPNLKFIRLSKQNNAYLEEVFSRILANNELLLEKKNKPIFNIIDSKIPFIFSLPGYQFYFSKGLIKKYFKNESLLISAFAFEIIKSGREIYDKKRIIPIGIIEIPQVLSMTRIDLEMKLEIYKWTYYALKRADYDASAILNWIQTQNKNTLDFSWQINDPRGISREEFMFKNFLVGLGDVESDIPEINSTVGFYRLQEGL